MPHRLTAADLPDGLTLRVDRVRHDGAWLRTWTMWVARTEEVPPDDRHDVVMVHGIGVSSAYFQRLAVALARFGTVRLLELPGFAGVPHTGARLGVADMGALVASWLRSAGLSRVLLLGQSMGAQVAVEAAVRDPGCAAHLALVGPTVNAAERSVPRQALRLAQSALREPAQVRAMSLEGYARCGWRWFAEVLPSVVRYPIEERVRAVDVPLLVLRGEHDALVPRAWARDLADRAPRGRWVEVAGASHSVVFDHVEQVERHLADLIAR